MEKVQIYTWFGDRFNETVAVRSMFALRFLNYHGIRHENFVVTLPKDMQKLEKEARTIPCIKRHDKFEHINQYLRSIKSSNFKDRRPLVLDDLNFDNRAILEWILTDLAGAYLYFVFEREDNRRRLMRNMLVKGEKPKDKDLKLITAKVSSWARHSSPWKRNYEEYVFYINKVIGDLDDRLGSRTYIMGNEICAVDIAMFSFLRLMCSPNIIEFSDILNHRKNLANWMHVIDSLTFGTYSKALNIGKAA